MRLFLEKIECYVQITYQKKGFRNLFYVIYDYNL